VGVVLTYVALVLLTWGALYAITGDAAALGGNLFSLLVVFVCSVMGGKISQVNHFILQRLLLKVVILSNNIKNNSDCQHTLKRSQRYHFDLCLLTAL
jgi:hypothetical protein